MAFEGPEGQSSAHRVDSTGCGTLSEGTSLCQVRGAKVVFWGFVAGDPKGCRVENRGFSEFAY